MMTLIPFKTKRQNRKLSRKIRKSDKTIREAQLTRELAVLKIELNNINRRRK